LRKKWIEDEEEEEEEEEEKKKRRRRRRMLKQNHSGCFLHVRDLLAPPPPLPQEIVDVDDAVAAHERQRVLAQAVRETASEADLGRARGCMIRKAI
jgi:hypothetical protein